MRPEGIAYFKRRAREEREIADRCRDPAVARTHLKLAREYERRLQGEMPPTAIPAEQSQPRAE